MEREFLALLRICVGALCVLIVCVLFYALFPHFDSGKGPEWVAAIGSVLALGGVAWSVQTQERYKRDEAFVKATVVAAAMTYHVVSTALDIRNLASEFSDVERVDCPPEFFSEALGRLQRLQKWNPADLAALAPLPGKIASQVAGGIDRLNAAITLLTHIHTMAAVIHFQDQRKSQAKFLAKILGESWQLLDAATKKMQLATHFDTSVHN